MLDELKPGDVICFDYVFTGSCATVDSIRMTYKGYFYTYGGECFISGLDQSGWLVSYALDNIVEGSLTRSK